MSRVREANVLAFAWAALDGRSRRDLDDRLCKLLHFHLNDELLQVSLGTIVLLLDDQLALRFSIALNLALELVEAVNHILLLADELLL